MDADVDVARAFLEGAEPAALFALVCGERAIVRGKGVRPTGRDAVIVKTAQQLFLERADAQTLLLKFIVSTRSPPRARECAETLLVQHIKERVAQHGIPQALLDALITQNEAALAALQRVLAALPQAETEAAILAALNDKPPP